MNQNSHARATAAADQLIASDREFVSKNFFAAGILAMRLVSALEAGEDEDLKLTKIEQAIVIRLAAHHLSALLLECETEGARDFT